MKIFSLVTVAFFIFSAFSGCSHRESGSTGELLNDEGLINAEFFLKKDTMTWFWNIREVPGRGTLIIQEGIVGDNIRSYEVYEKDRPALEKHAARLHRKKIAEGYRIYNPEDYSHIIIQVDGAISDTTNDIDKFVLIEELINQSLVNTGNGRCTGSDLNTGVSYFAVVFDPEKAAQTILQLISEENLGISVVIAVETGSDIRVIHPDNFQGNFSLI